MDTQIELILNKDTRYGGFLAKMLHDDVYMPKFNADIWNDYDFIDENIHDEDFAKALNVAINDTLIPYPQIKKVLPLLTKYNIINQSNKYIQSYYKLTEITQADDYELIEFFLAHVNFKDRIFSVSSYEYNFIMGLFCNKEYQENDIKFIYKLISKYISIKDIDMLFFVNEKSLTPCFNWLLNKYSIEQIFKHQGFYIIKSKTSLLEKLIQYNTESFISFLQQSGRGHLVNEKLLTILLHHIRGKIAISKDLQFQFKEIHEQRRTEIDKYIKAIQLWDKDIQHKTLKKIFLRLCSQSMFFYKKKFTYLEEFLYFDTFTDEMFLPEMFKIIPECRDYVPDYYFKLINNDWITLEHIFFIGFICRNILTLSPKNIIKKSETFIYDEKSKLKFKEAAKLVKEDYQNKEIFTLKDVEKLSPYENKINNLILELSITQTDVTSKIII